MIPTTMSFEERYHDGSGVEYAVRLMGDSIQIESVNTVDFPTDQLDWLIEALIYIKESL